MPPPPRCMTCCCAHAHSVEGKGRRLYSAEADVAKRTHACCAALMATLTCHVILSRAARRLPINRAGGLSAGSLPSLQWHTCGRILKPWPIDPARSFISAWMCLEMPFVSLCSFPCTRDTRF